MEEEIYLAKPKEEAMRGFFPELSVYQSCPSLYKEVPPLQLFVPGEFILGHFIDMENGIFVLSGTIYFTDNPANLEKYKGGVNRGRIEIVQNILASQYQIDDLVWKSKRYIEYRKNLGDFGAFQLRVVRDNKNDLINGILNVLDEVNSGV